MLSPEDVQQIVIDAVTSDRLTPTQIAEIALRSTVYLQARMSHNTGVFASGFVIGGGRVAATYHQIADMKSATVRLVNGTKTYTVLSVIAVDKHRDVAILEADIQAPPLPLGDSDALAIGQPVYVAGNPDGYLGTFSSGVISALRFDGAGWGKGALIQITAPVSRKSSGSPVLNSDGEVIGIATGIDMDGQNLNFVVPVNALKSLLSTID